METTLFNYYFLTDPERKEEIAATHDLFKKIKLGIYESFISDIVVVELEKCKDIKQRNDMLHLLSEYDINRLTTGDYEDFEKLAGKYIVVGAIPKQKQNDAFHIACATLSRMDILVSWNCEHIVRYKTQQLVRAINLVEGFEDIGINTPMEI